MTRSTFIHYVKDVKVTNYDPNNANSITMEVDTSSGMETFHLFGMDREVAEDFYKRNAGSVKDTSKDLERRVQILEYALERIAYENVRVVDIGSIAKEALASDPEYHYIPF